MIIQSGHYDDVAAHPVPQPWTDADLSFCIMEQDALKLLNTDITVPNLYSMSADSEQLSIDGIPYPADSTTTIPLVLKLKKDGLVMFMVKELESMPSELNFYLCDNKTGLYQNLRIHPEYVTYLREGDYENRFSLVITNYDIRPHPADGEPFFVYSSRDRIFVFTQLSNGESADLFIHNMLGQKVFSRKIYRNGYSEIDLDVRPGAYLVSIYSSGRAYSKKIVITNPW